MFKHEELNEILQNIGTALQTDIPVNGYHPTILESELGIVLIYFKLWSCFYYDGKVIITYCNRSQEHSSSKRRTTIKSHISDPELISKLKQQIN